jgi:hypothetical protein
MNGRKYRKFRIDSFNDKMSAFFAKMDPAKMLAIAKTRQILARLKGLLVFRLASSESTIGEDEYMPFLSIHKYNITH